MEKIHQIFLNLAFILSLMVPFTAVFSGVGVRFELWSAMTGFAILKYSVFAAVLALVLAIAAVCLAHFIALRLFNKRITFSITVSCLVALVPYIYQLEFRKIPTLADATSNIDNPPSFIEVASMRNVGSKITAEEAAKHQREYFPELQGLITGYDKNLLIGVAEQVAREMDMEIVSSSPDMGRLEATATTLWFGFKDDLVVRVLPQPDGNTLLDARSASRVGYLDGGVNGKRVEKLLAEIKARLPK